MIKNAKDGAAEAASSTTPTIPKPTGAFAAWPDAAKEAGASSETKKEENTFKPHPLAVVEMVKPVKRKLWAVELAWGAARGYKWAQQTMQGEAIHPGGKDGETHREVEHEKGGAAEQPEGWSGEEQHEEHGGDGQEKDQRDGEEQPQKPRGGEEKEWHGEHGEEHQGWNEKHAEKTGEEQPDGWDEVVGEEQLKKNVEQVESNNRKDGMENKVTEANGKMMDVMEKVTDGKMMEKAKVTDGMMMDGMEKVKVKDGMKKNLENWMNKGKAHLKKTNP